MIHSWLNRLLSNCFPISIYSFFFFLLVISFICDKESKEAFLGNVLGVRREKAKLVPYWDFQELLYSGIYIQEFHWFFFFKVSSGAIGLLGCWFSITTLIPDKQKCITLWQGIISNFPLNWNSHFSCQKYFFS